MRRALVTSTGAFSIAIAAGMSAGIFAVPVALPAPEQAAVSTEAPPPPAELRAMAELQRPRSDDPQLLSVIPVNEQALPLAREAEDPTPTPTPTPTSTPRPSEPARAPSPALASGERVQATVSFYYCERGESGQFIGDGGGFCGQMRNGAVVHEGAAACDAAYLGQRFRIEGDPLGRVYVCADTGSAVHGQHRDIWFHDSDDGWAWQRSIGNAAVIEILE